ncbi:MAG: hypothetical protein QUS11_07430 [Candidatus Fermentibacter sp.]|nr:hypothetical protein [Candidatus Fermentibacter sp.]
MEKPRGLPRGFDRIYNVLSAADESTGSRRRMAESLRVSTHTLQRILTDGDVPDLSLPQSSYITGSWARTITRIACGLGLDAFELVRSTGLPIDARIEGIIRSEAAGDGARVRPREQGGNGHFDDLAGFMLALLGPSNGGSGTVASARRQLEDSLRNYLVSTGATAPGLAGSEELAEGAFCRSCMSSLLDEHNRGPSDRYCRWCSDSEGRLRTADEVRGVLTNWFMHWQPGITREVAEGRVRHYMLSMPAWSELAAQTAESCGEGGG